MTLSSSLEVQPGQTSAKGLWVSAGALSPDLGLESSGWGGLEKRLRVEQFHSTFPQARAAHFHASLCTTVPVPKLPSHLVQWKLEGGVHLLMG